MTDQILVDTNILIDISRNFEPTIELLKRYEARATLVVSAMTQMELIIGCQNKEALRAVDLFLRGFPIVTINESISDRAISLLETYFLSHGLLPGDGLIAATAIEHSWPLLTRNQKDFRFIDAISLLPLA